MSEHTYKYVIIGGGLAGASAVEGIRERDQDGEILLIGAENHLPYDRPPLTKKLWFGKKKVEEIFIHDDEYYTHNCVELVVGVEITHLDVDKKTLKNDHGRTIRYENLLLATGGTPRTLGIPGGDLEGICYYRFLDDYLRTRRDASEGKSALVIGGGFIGSEIAAALNINKLDVTMVFPGDYFVPRVFPEDLGRALQSQFVERGVKVVTGDEPASIELKGGRYLTRTKKGRQIETDLVIVGVGITPNVALAQQAGLAVDNGIVVNELLQSSRPEICAAGDNAGFPYLALGERMRIEHWDNALNQGKHAGRNMAGANAPYDYMPYFFSDLFEFGYEAVGDVSTKLETFADWQKEFDTGVIYYLKDGKVRGAMMCNVWDKVDAARELIRAGKTVSLEELRGAIR